jgi:hypothetical protein
MELSNGGSEWLMLCNPAPNGGASIKTMNPATLSVVTAGTIPGGFGATLRVVPSGTMNKAYVRTSAPALIPFSTDPTIGPLPTMPQLPLWGFELQALVD